MNTKQVQEQIANLKSADIAAYKAGTKSNFLLNFVRNELIKRAFAMDSNLAKEVTVDISMTIASYIMPSLALLSKAGQYPELFSSAVINLVDGEIKFTYTIKADGLSDEYRAKLNENLGISIPVAVEAVV